MDEWPPGLTFLQDLEELMKCPICFDLMQAPVILPGCDHNYCSLCIRRYFTHKEQCPTCCTPASSNQLRSNGIMEKTIRQFKKIRSPLQSICVGNLSQSKTQESGSDSSSQDSAGRRNVLRSEKPTRPDEDVDTYDGPSAVARTLRNRPAPQPCSDSEDSDVQIVSGDENCSLNSSSSFPGNCVSKSQWPLLSPFHSQTEAQKPKNVQSKLFGHLSVSGNRTASPIHGSKSGAKENVEGKRELTAKTLAITSPKAVSLSHTSPVQNCKLATSRSPSPRVLSPLSQRKSDVSLGSSSLQETPLVGKVACPVCGVPVVTQAVNRHLDLCLGRQEKRSSPCVREKRKPLPKLVYNLLSDKDIRKRLKDLGLNSKGDRQVLIKRHHEFTLYHNADCDSLSPKDIDDLVKEFEETQKLQVKLASKSTTSGQSILRFTKDAKQEDIEKAQQEYVAQHKDQFKSLIKEVRNRMKPARSCHSTSTCLTEPVLKNSVNDCIQEENSKSRTSSANTISIQKMCVIRDDEGVGSDNGDDDNDVISDVGGIQGEASESETTRERWSPAHDGDDVDGDMTNEDSISVVKLSIAAKLKMASAKPSLESVNTSDVFIDKSDSGDETGSDVFEQDHRSKRVRSTSSLSGRGKRTLRPSKPRWQDTDLVEMSTSSRESETLPSGLTFDRSSSVFLFSTSDEEDRAVSGNSQPVNHTDRSITFPVETSESQRTLNRPATVETVEKLQQLARSASQHSVSHWQGSVTQKHSFTDHSSQISHQLSDECGTSSDRESIDVSSDHKPVKGSDAIVSSNKESIAAFNDYKPVKAGNVTVGDVTVGDVTVGDVTVHSCPPATGKDHAMHTPSDCFELNLSDCEDEEELFSTQELDYIDHKKEDGLHNGRGDESCKKYELTPAEINFGTLENMDKSDSVETDDVGETSEELLTLQTEQEAVCAEYLSDVNKPKSLLKKGSCSAALFKKSVRFAGMRARLSDIQIEKLKSSKKKPNIDGVRMGPSFKVTAVKIDDADFPTVKNGIEYQDKTEEVGKAGHLEKKKKGKSCGKEMETKTNKKKKKHGLPAGPSEDFTCLKELAAEAPDTSAADTSVAQNASVSPVDQEHETFKTMTNGKEAKAGCRPEKLSTKDEINCPIRSVVSDSLIINSVTDQSYAASLKLPQNSHKQCPGSSVLTEKRNRRKQKSESEHSPKIVLPAVMDCPAEQSVDTHQPGSKKKRKRSRRSVATDVQQIATESLEQTETLQTVHKKRKTSKSSSSTALHAVPESCTDLSKQSAAHEQQGQARVDPPIIPESCLDIPEKPVRTGRRKHRASKSEDDTQHTVAVSQFCETESQKQGKRKENCKGKKRKLHEVGESSRKGSG